MNKPRNASTLLERLKTGLFNWALGKHTVALEGAWEGFAQRFSAGF